jgi:uncharacterized alkaline shock family protein YloU
MSSEPYLGRIEVSPRAIGSIAGQTVLESYGVVGMAPKHPRDDFAELLPGANFRRGVDVHYMDGAVVIDLYVVIEYGTRISEVAQGIKNRVKFNVERATGLSVAKVNVHVQGLRVSKT